MKSLFDLFLEKRGYTKEYLQKIEQKPNDELQDIDLICAHLDIVKMNKEKIIVLPDFDMDGIASGTLGYAGLAELGFDVGLYRPIPSDGYGFREQDIDKIISEFPNVKAIISCDTGITCYQGVKYAKDKGIKVLITDHHLEEENKPQPLVADVVVNPNRLTDTYTNKGICGANVFYKILRHYALNYSTNDKLEQIERLSVFAGIGTMSDVMPLVYENRQLVRDAVSICRLFFNDGDDRMVDVVEGHPVYRTVFKGLYVVLDLFYKMGKITTRYDIDEDFFGFYLAPMFNSVKRLDRDMNIAFGIFFNKDHQQDLAEELYQLNEERKQLVSGAYMDIFERKQKFTPHFYLTDSSSGIAGLLATKIMNNTHVPTFVIHQNPDGSFNGSGRSPEWFPAVTILRNEGFYVAGHEGAFGIHINDVWELNNIFTFVQKYVRDFISKHPDLLKGSVDADIEIGKDINIDISEFFRFLRRVEHIRPFGRDFPTPSFKITFNKNDVALFRMGSEKQHLKFTLPYGFIVLCFGQSTIFDNIAGDEITVIGRLRINEYNDMFTVSLMGDIVC